MRSGVMTSLVALFVVWGCDIAPYEPCACPRIYQPVCAESGITYSNDCEAACQQDPVAFPAPCDALSAEGWLVETGPEAPGCGFQFFPQEGGILYPASLPTYNLDTTTWVHLFYQIAPHDYPCQETIPGSVIQIYSLQTE
jgi:hypothetical protein